MCVCVQTVIRLIVRLLNEQVFKRRKHFNAIRFPIRAF